MLRIQMQTIQMLMEVKNTFHPRQTLIPCMKDYRDQPVIRQESSKDLKTICRNYIAISSNTFEPIQPFVRFIIVDCKFSNFLLASIAINYITTTPIFCRRRNEHPLSQYIICSMHSFWNAFT